MTLKNNLMIFRIARAYEFDGQGRFSRVRFAASPPLVSAMLKGASGDGVYGGAIEKLAAGEYFVEARAETHTKIAVAGVAIGVKPAAREIKKRVPTGGLFSKSVRTR